MTGAINDRIVGDQANHGQGLAETHGICNDAAVELWRFVYLNSVRDSVDETSLTIDVSGVFTGFRNAKGNMAY